MSVCMYNVVQQNWIVARKRATLSPTHDVFTEIAATRLYIHFIYNTRKIYTYICVCVCVCVCVIRVENKLTVSS